MLTENEMLFFGLVFAGISTLGGLIFSGYETMKLRSEKKQTLRPWIGETKEGLSVTKLYNSSNETVFPDTWIKMTDSQKEAFGCTRVEWKIPLKNFGQIPAIDVQGRIIVAINEKPLKEKLGKFGDKFVIMPDNEYAFLFVLDAVTSDNIQRSTVTAYLGFDFKYGSSYQRQEWRYGFSIRMTGGTGYRILKTWDERHYERMSATLADE